MTVKEISEGAQRVHKEAIIVDMLEVVFPRIDAEYFKTLIDAGVTAIQATIPHVADDLPAAIIKIAKFYKLIESTENAKIAFTADDIERAKKEGKVAIIAGMQDSIPFERDLDLIKIFQKLGIKVMQIAYYQQNYLGSGCVERVDHGLTDRGRKAIEEFNSLGILIDVSHCGDKTAMDAVETSKYPIAITHSTPATLVDIVRAKDDETIKAVAEKGGVIGQVIWTPFCERKDKIGVQPSLSDFVDIIDYLVDLVGIDYVGIGSDLCPFWKQKDYDEFMKSFGVFLIHPHKVPFFENVYVEGFHNISDTIKITEELLRHGHSDNEVKKILGGNWLRLLKEVWK